MAVAQLRQQGLHESEKTGRRLSDALRDTRITCGFGQKEDDCHAAEVAYDAFCKAPKEEVLQALRATREKML